MNKSARMLLPLLVLVFVVMGCSEEARKQSRERAEIEASEAKAEKARDGVADELSEKFDIQPDCLFRFSTGGTRSKTLYVKNCSAKKGVTSPEQFLEVSDRQTLKRLGFEEIIITSWESAAKAYTTVYTFNEDSTLKFVGYK
jgi:hypothetical protein